LAQARSVACTPGTPPIVYNSFDSPCVGMRFVRYTRGHNRCVVETCLLALLAPPTLAESSLASQSLTPLTTDSGTGGCLVQSSRRVFKAPLQQPDVPFVDVVSQWVNESEHSAEATVNGTRGFSPQDAPPIKKIKFVYEWVLNCWGKFAFNLCLHWKATVLIFTLIFLIVFPIMHWMLEYREVERYMFNDSDRRQAGMSEEHDMLRHIRINRSGGLTKIRHLVEVDRPKLRRLMKLTALVGTVSFNVFMLVEQDVALLVGAAEYYNGDRFSPLPSVLKRYLEFTGNISLISVRHAACVALAELLGLSAMLIWILYRTIVFFKCRNSNKSKFDAFLALHEAFEATSLLGSFSALRLVSLAHPDLVQRQFEWNMARSFFGGTSTKHRALQFVYFFVTRVAAVFVGVLAFGVKLAFTSVQVHMPFVEGHWSWTFVWRWMVVLMLLEQTLGAVGVEHVMLWRLKLVVVEGGDRKVSLEKIHIMQVYLSRIMESIYEEYWCKGKYFQFILLMCTFDHIDLQHLLVDEGPEHPKLPLALTGNQSEPIAGTSAARRVLEPTAGSSADSVTNPIDGSPAAATTSSLHEQLSPYTEPS